MLASILPGLPLDHEIQKPLNKIYFYDMLIFYHFTKIEFRNFGHLKNNFFFKNSVLRLFIIFFDLRFFYCYFFARIDFVLKKALFSPTASPPASYVNSFLFTTLRLPTAAILFCYKLLSLRAAVIII
jgi:hypothetical protein